MVSITLSYLVAWLLSFVCGFVGGPGFAIKVLHVISSFAIISLGMTELEDSAGCFTSIYSCFHAYVFVLMPLPFGAMGSSVIWDCDISWSYLLAFQGLYLANFTVVIWLYSQW